MKGGVVNLADGGTSTLRVSHAVRRPNQGVFVLQTSCASLGTLGKCSLSKWNTVVVVVVGGSFSYTSHIGKPFCHDLGSTSVVVNVNYGRQTKGRARAPEHRVVWSSSRSKVGPARARCSSREKRTKAVEDKVDKIRHKTHKQDTGALKQPQEMLLQQQSFILVVAKLRYR